MPMLVDTTTGMPCFETAIYLLTCRRARGLAANSLARDASCIRVLRCWAMQAGVDLRQRFTQCSYLSLSEIDDLARSLRLTFRQLSSMDELDARPPRPARLHVTTRVRLNEVDRSTAAGRFHVIRHYLEWLADFYEPRDFTKESDRTTARLARCEMLRRFEARRVQPPKAPQDPRLGLTQKQIDALLCISDPGSAANPWRGAFVKDRNRLIVRMLLDLGVRRGELLSVRVRDINFQSNILAIRRHPDDPSDPRADQPTAKTRGRDLMVTDELGALLRDHVLQHRRKRPNAARHDFLLVNAIDGAPLSTTGLSDIFKKLRRGCAELPSTLSAHPLRHTWNDQYSRLMKERNVPEAQEIRTRSYLMGWTETSGTAAKYTRRFVREAADEASLAIQKRLRKSHEK